MVIDSVQSATVLSKAECQHLISQAQRTPLQEAKVFFNKGMQSSNIRAVKGTEVESEAMRQFVFSQFKKFNALGFELSGMEPLQIFKYEVGDHYDWHTDWSPVNNKKRKLSITIQLSEPADYEGGEVEILDGPISRVVPKDLGMATVFPSWVVHRVRPITSGTRWALVAWATGKPFK
jgi:PKHD-type hydroxylase